MLYKQVQSARQISTVLIKKKQIEAHVIQKKKDDFERREMIHLIKQKLINDKRNAIRKNERQLKWVKILNLMVMVDFIRKYYFKEIIRKKIKQKRLEVYKQVWENLKLVLVARGNEKFIRLSWDMLMSCKLFGLQQKKRVKTRIKKVFVDFLKRTSVLLCWNMKLIQYRDESIEIIFHHNIIYSS